MNLKFFSLFIFIVSILILNSCKKISEKAKESVLEDKSFSVTKIHEYKDYKVLEDKTQLCKFKNLEKCFSIKDFDIPNPVIERNRVFLRNKCRENEKEVCKLLDRYMIRNCRAGGTNSCARLLTECSLGDVYACSFLYDELKKGCIKNNFNFCITFSVLLDYIKMFKASNQLLQDICQKGNQEACALYEYKQFKKGSVQAEELIKPLDKVCMSGATLNSANACLELVSILDKQGITNVYKYYKKACELGNLKGCFQQGMFLFKNKKVKLANKLFKKVCFDKDSIELFDEYKISCLNYFLYYLKKGLGNSAFDKYLIDACKGTKYLELTCSYQGMTELFKKKIKNFKKQTKVGCLGGYHPSCLDIAVENIFNSNLNQAKIYMERACLKEPSFPCSFQKEFISASKMNVRKKLITFLKKSCAKGVGQACWYLELQKTCPNAGDVSCIFTKRNKKKLNIKQLFHKTFQTSKKMLPAYAIWFKIQYAILLKEIGRRHEGKKLLENLCSGERHLMSLMSCYARNEWFGKNKKSIKKKSKVGKRRK